MTRHTAIRPIPLAFALPRGHVVWAAISIHDIPTHMTELLASIKLKVPGLEKLIEVVASGIGGVAGPLLAPWRARKEGQAAIVTAKARAEILKIEAEAHRTARDYLVPNGADYNSRLEFGSLVRERMEYQESKRLANIHSVVAGAAVMLEGMEVEDAEPDHDWTARFFNDVQDVSSEQLQQLWARVLKGEVERPGSTSMRALSILKNLDARTAELFGVLCSAAVYLTTEEGDLQDARVLYVQEVLPGESLEEIGLDSVALNRLNEHGLIIPDYSTYLPTTAGGDLGSAELWHQSMCWGLVNKNKDQSIQPHVEPLGVAMTVAGRELSRAVPREAMPTYTENLRQFLLWRFNVEMVAVDSPTT